MDRKQLKQTGKDLFKKNYWYSVVVAFLMAFTGTSSSPSFNFSFNTSGSENSSFEGLFGNGSSNAFFDEFFGGGNLDAFFDEFIQEPIAIVFFIILISVIVVASVLGYFVFNSFKCGGIRYFLKSRKNQPVQIHEVFENLKDKTNINIAKVTFSRDVSVFLWTLLFIVPGVIKSYEYWAIDYILAVRPDIDKDEAKRLSKTIMDGNKAELFVLGLSFLGWIFLSVFTMGLLNIFYLNPYMQATFVEFFSDIRLQALAMGKITPNDIPDYEFIEPQMQYQQQFYGQPKNVVYRPDGSPTGNTVYTQQPFQQPFQHPAQQTFSQPTEPVVESPVEGTVVETPIEEPVVEPVTEPTNEEANDII